MHLCRRPETGRRSPGRETTQGPVTRPFAEAAALRGKAIAEKERISAEVDALEARRRMVGKEAEFIAVRIDRVVAALKRYPALEALRRPMLRSAAVVARARSCRRSCTPAPLHYTPCVGSFPTSHLLFCPATGTRLAPADVEALRALVEGCGSKRSYVPSHWRGTDTGTIEAQVQFKSGPYEALELIWKELRARLRCVWVRDSDEAGGLDWIYKIDGENVAADDYYNPCDRRAWYAFDELRVVLEPASAFQLPAPWERLGDELRVRAVGAYYSDNNRYLFDNDGTALPTPTTLASGDGQPVFELPSLQGFPATLGAEFDRHATRIDASYRGRLVRHCVRAHDDTWPRWRSYAFDHWDNCLDERFLRDQQRDDEALPAAIYALPHPRL